MDRDIPEGTVSEITRLINETQVVEPIDNTQISEISRLVGMAFVERDPKRLVEIALTITFGKETTGEEKEEVRSKLVEHVKRIDRYMGVGSVFKAGALASLDESFSDLAESFHNSLSVELGRLFVAESIVELAVLAHASKDPFDFKADWSQVVDYYSR